jgi:hypothetical protein
MKIEVSYDELLDIVNALRHRADIFEQMPAPLDPAQRGRESPRTRGSSARSSRRRNRGEAMMQAKRSAHPTKWSLIFSTKVMRFDTQIEAEAEPRMARKSRPFSCDRPHTNAAIILLYWPR